MALIGRRAFAFAGVFNAARGVAQERKSAKPVFRKADVAPRVIQIIVKLLEIGAEKVKPQARFIEDLGADSLNVAELVMNFEDTFDIEIDDGAAKKMLRVSDAVALVERLLREGKRLV